MVEDFFAINTRIMRASGIYPPQTTIKWKRLLIIAFNITCVSYSMIFFTIAELVAIRESSSNIADLVKNLNMSMSFILTLSKITVWYFHHDELIGIMNTLQSSTEFFTPIADFNPKQIIEEEKRVKDRLTYTFFILAFTVPTSACALTLFNLIHSNDFDFKLPYHSFVPFDYKTSEFKYALAVVYQCAALLNCGMITVGFDMLFYSIVCFTSTHLKLLQGAFSTIKEKVLLDLSKNQKAIIDQEILEKRMYDQLRKCIRHLQLILDFCEKFESIFNYLLLLQILVSLVVFCTCLYIVSTIPMGSNIFGNEIAYMLAIENQLALYCYAGNKLTTRASDIPDAIFGSDWIATSSKSYHKNVLFTIMRMTKPIYLTAGRFTVMTLATFVTIGRGSYSLLAVLKNGKN